MSEPGGAVQRVRLGAYGWIEDGGRVLLVRIADGTPDTGRWTLPGGGLDFGEDPSEGAAREIDEETGFTARIGEILGIHSLVLEPGVTVSGDRIHTVGIVYRATVAAGELRNEADGTTDVAAWIPFDELDELPVVGLLTWTRGIIGR